MLTRTTLPGYAAAILDFLDRELPNAHLAMPIPSAATRTMATRAARHCARNIGTLHKAVESCGRRPQCHVVNFPPTSDG